MTMSNIFARSRMDHSVATDCQKRCYNAAQRLKTAFGAFLAPVVDKLLVAAVLILLSTWPIQVGPYAGNTSIMPIISTGGFPAYSGQLYRRLQEGCVDCSSFLP